MRTVRSGDAALTYLADAGLVDVSYEGGVERAKPTERGIERVAHLLRAVAGLSPGDEGVDAGWLLGEALDSGVLPNDLPELGIAAAAESGAEGAAEVAVRVLTVMVVEGFNRVRAEMATQAGPESWREPEQVLVEHGLIRLPRGHGVWPMMTDDGRGLFGEWAYEAQQQDALASFVPSGDRLAECVAEVCAFVRDSGLDDDGLPDNSLRLFVLYGLKDFADLMERAKFDDRISHARRP